MLNVREIWCSIFGFLLGLNRLSITYTVIRTIFLREWNVCTRETLELAQCPTGFSALQISWIVSNWTRHHSLLNVHSIEVGLSKHRKVTLWGSQFPAKYYRPLRSKWQYTLRFSDGHKRQFIPAVFESMPSPTKLKMTVLLCQSFLSQISSDSDNCKPIKLPFMTIT